MFCSKCGNEVAEGSAFCNSCGNPLGQSPAPVADSTASVGAAPNSASVGAYGANPAAFEGADSSSASAGVAAARKKPILPIAIAVIVVAVIGVAIFTGGFGLLSSGSGVDPKDSLEDYTWEELSAISGEIATASNEDKAIEIAKKYNLVNEDGTLDGTQTKSVTLTDGTVTSVQIAGFLHDDKSDGSGKAGITFIFTDVITGMYMSADGSNDGGWESSDMRSWLASEGKALLPEELQGVIVSVDKYTNNVGVTQDTSSVTTTSDELWLFSYVELAGELDESDAYGIAGELDADELAEIMAYFNVLNAEGSQYKLFSDCGVSSYSYSNYILTKTYQGDSCNWWQRSPYPYLSDAFMCVYPDGDPYNVGNADNSIAVVPGFCV